MNSQGAREACDDLIRAVLYSLQTDRGPRPPRPSAEQECSPCQACLVGLLSAPSPPSAPRRQGCATTPAPASRGSGGYASAWRRGARDGA
eukprot:4220746-Pyramimonas_sp.AAC.1